MVQKTAGKKGGKAPPQHINFLFSPISYLEFFLNGKSFSHFHSQTLT